MEGPKKKFVTLKSLDYNVVMTFRFNNNNNNNLVLAGHCPDAVAATFFGGRLIALNKKSGGIRPIAIGFTLRRLSSKCTNAYAFSHLATFFRPTQLVVGTPGGCETAVHSARRFLQTMPADHVLVKLDFSNAFNSLH